MTLLEAIQRAESQGYDLVQITVGNDEIPVCKILDYNKFKYQQKQKQKAVKTKKIDLKEVKISFNIAEGDFNTKIERARRFIDEGNNVKFTIVLRGRQKALLEVALQKIVHIKANLEDIAKVEKEQLDLKGSSLFVIMMPKGTVKK